MYGTLCLINGNFRFHPLNGDKKQQVNYLNSWGYNWNKDNIQIYDIPNTKNAYVIYDKSRKLFMDAIGFFKKDYSELLFKYLISDDSAFEEKGVTT